MVKIPFCKSIYLQWNLFATSNSERSERAALFPLGCIVLFDSLRVVDLADSFSIAKFLRERTYLLSELFSL